MLTKTLERFFDKPFFTDLIYPFHFEDGAYLLIDGSLGMMWEIEGINIDGKSPEDLQKASSTFSNFLKSLPHDLPMQIIVATWRGLEQSSLDVYREGDLSNPYVDEYMQRKLEWHEHGKLHGFSHEGTTHFYPKTIKVYFTVKQKRAQSSNGGLFSALSSNGNLYDAASMKETRDKLARVEMVVDTSLSSGGIAHKRVAPDALISLMYRVLNPDRALAVPPPTYAGGDLRQYMVSNSPEADQEGWTFEDKKYSVISFANNPAIPADDGSLETFPNILFREVNGVSLIDLAPMMMFTINFHFPSQDALNRKLNAKRTLAFLHRFNFFGDVSIDKEIAREESRKLLQLMYAGEKIVKASYHLCIPSAPEESEFTTQQILSYLNISTGSNAHKEDLIAAPIFMRCLPFGFDQDVPNEEQFVRRAGIATSAVVADVAPVYPSGKGVRTAKASGSYNRRGQDAWFDPFDRDTAITSPHFLMTGATGSGKTVRLIDMASQFLRRPATTFILEKGQSCRNFIDLAGGQYLRFEGEPNFVLDPFAGDFGDDHRAFLTALLANMITGGTERITREEVAYLSEAVLSLSTMAKTERNMRGLVNELKASNEPIGIAAARKLFPFHGSGQYARFLEGDKPRFGITNTLFGADLADLDMYKDLQSVVIFLLIFYITEHVKKITGDKILFVDEAWSLFRNDAAVDFLVGSTKTFRKHGCANGFSTQQLDDFAVIAKAMNMRDNCPNKILLYQEMDVVTRNAEALELNQATLDLYKTIKKGKGYSEALIVTQNWTSVSRTTLDPVSYWIATSSRSDSDYLNDLRERGLSLRDAIHHAAKEHPFGVHSTGATP